MAYLITKDNDADKGAKPGTCMNAVGVVGPRTTKLTAEQIKAHPNAQEFRMRTDDDGDPWVYYRNGLPSLNRADTLSPFTEPRP